MQRKGEKIYVKDKMFYNGRRGNILQITCFRMRKLYVLRRYAEEFIAFIL